MKIRKIAVAAVLSGALAAAALTGCKNSDGEKIKSDLKELGEDTKDAAKNTGNGIKEGVKEVGKGFKKGWEKATD